MQTKKNGGPSSGHMVCAISWKRSRLLSFSISRLMLFVVCKLSGSPMASTRCTLPFSHLARSQCKVARYLRTTAEYMVIVGKKREKYLPPICIETAYLLFIDNVSQ